jgi:polyketide synthase PksN
MDTDQLKIAVILEKIKSKAIPAAKGFELIKNIRGNPLPKAAEAAPFFLFDIIWRPNELDSSLPVTRGGGPLLIFDPEPELWLLLKDILQDEAGLIWAAPGAAFADLGDGKYQINPLREEDYRRLFTTLHNRGLMPERIIHSGSDADFNSEPGTLKLLLEKGFLSLFNLVRPLLQGKFPTAPGIIYVYATHGKIQPQFAAVGAFTRTVSLENSSFQCKTIGMERIATVEAGKALLREFEAGPEEGREILYRNGERWVRRLTEITPGTEGAALPLKEEGVYLITGGAGALGLKFAQYLCGEYRARLILTGRSPLSAPKEKLLATMQSNGGEVVYIRADVSDREEVIRLLGRAKQRFGGIDGVIHSAGLNRDALICKKSGDEIAVVLAPKVAGTINLDELTGAEELDFFAVFSSVAAVLGNRGQSDYAYANSFMDHYAETREELRRAGRRKGKTLVLNWPLWEDAGMNVDEPTRNIMATLAGVRPLPFSKGVAAFRSGLASPGSRLMVMYGDPAKIRNYLRGEMGRPEELGGPPEPHPDSDAGGEGGEDSGIIFGIKTKLAALVSSILKIDAQRINYGDDMQEYGFDSVTQTQLINEINEFYGAEISPAVFYELREPTLACLAEHLYRESRELFQTHFRKTGADRPVSGGLPEKSAPAGVKESAFSIATVPGPVPLIERQEESGADGPVAIIGMSCVMPDSPDAAAFWENIAAGRELISPLPDARLKLGAFAGLNPAAERGGFIADIDRFDARFFGIAPREAELMDPQQRVFLQIVWQTIENAGYKVAELAESRTGVFVGAASGDYFELWKESGAGIDPYASTGMAASILANRISYLLNWHGPSQTMDTACSSSLISVIAAVDALNAGRCDLAVAGGVNLLFSSTAFRALNAAGMLSPAGRCRSFDADADGYVRGEGAGALLLKPLARAVADGDHIYAVIRGTAVNHGGKANSLTAPNANAQAGLLLEAYRRAGIDPSRVTYIETHGTGTRLGDPVEINGLKKAFAGLCQQAGIPIPSRPHCGIGSVKANIGHLEAAAGIAGIIKLLLALEHRKLPGLAGFEKLNPLIDLEGTPFYIAAATQTWDRLRREDGAEIPRIAGVSSFGFGGANAHIVLEEYPQPEPVAQSVPAQVMALSAQNEDRLREYASRLLEHIRQVRRETEGDCNFDGMAFTLQVGRANLAERLALVVKDGADFQAKLERYCDGSREIEGCYRGNGGFTGRMAAGPEVESAIRRRDLEHLAAMWAGGADIDWRKLYRQPWPSRVALPSAPFETKSFWFSPSHAPVAKAETAVRRLTLKKPEAANQPAAAAAGSPKIPADAGKGRIREVIIGRLTQILHVNREELAADIPMREYGLDSIGCVELVNAINKEFDTGFKTVIIYDYPTVDKLAAYLTAVLKPEGGAGAESAASPVTGSPRAAHQTVTGLEPATGSDVMLQPAWNRVRELRNQIVGRLAQILHLSPDEVDEELPMQEYGLDSIGGVELVNALNQTFRTGLKAVILYDYPTVVKLAVYLDSMLKADSDRLLTSVPNGGPDGVVPASGRDVAIIGMAGRFPGSRDVGEFWERLANGTDCVTEIPKSRWDADRFYHPDPAQPGKSYCKWGGFVDDVDRFDPLFFRISPTEAEVIDPQQRLFLETSYQAFEDAGYSAGRLDGVKCGVYVGIVNINDYGALLHEARCHENLGHAMLGNANSILASRISYFHNLKGPAIAVDTACSSSLVAIHLAYRALLEGEIEMALAGGVMLQLSQKRFVLVSKSGALSHRGRCSAFDNRADGYVPGEGVGAIVLKRLDRALADRDRIYGVIKGSALNQDGATNGVTAPSAASQRSLELEVYRSYNIHPETLTYIEAHGTGTKLGDPIELAALTGAFQEYTSKKAFCGIGSVKTNIGHGAASAGIASVIKVLLALEHRQIPPSLHYEVPNEHLQLEESPFYVNTSLREWTVPTGVPRRAGVSGFGLSGTNCHLVIEEPPATAGRDRNFRPAHHLILLSAKTETALEQKVRDLEAFLVGEGSESDIEDIGYTLAVGRSGFDFRLALVVGGLEELVRRLGELKSNGFGREGCFLGVKKKASGQDPQLEEECRKLVENLSEPAKVGRESCRNMLLALADRFVRGYSPDWARLFANRDVRTITLPAYPFERQRCWWEANPAADAGAGRSGRGEERNDSIRDRLTALEDDGRGASVRSFRATLNGTEFYLTDHIIGGAKVFPAVACLEMARAAGEMLLGSEVTLLKNIILAQPLIIKDGPVAIFLRISEGEGRLEFKISSEGENGVSTDHSQGYIVSGDSRLAPGDESIPVETVKSRCDRQLDQEGVYEIYRKVGVEYGPRFQSIRRLYYNPREALAVLEPDLIRATERGGFGLHPALLDALLQTTLGIALGQPDAGESNYLPFVIGEVAIMGDLSGACYGYATKLEQSRKAGGKIMKFDIKLLDASGKVVVRLKDFSARAMGERQSGQILPEAAASVSGHSGIAYYSGIYEPVPLAAGCGRNDADGAILLFDEGDVLARSLAGMVKFPLILIKPGASFGGEGDRVYRVNPGSEADYHRLCAALEVQGITPGLIIHNWSRRYWGSGSATVERSLEYGLYSMFGLTKALLQLKTKEPVRLLYVYPDSREEPQPQYRAVSAFIKSVRRESPRLIMKTVAVFRDSMAEAVAMIPELAGALLAEFGEAAEEEVRYQDRTRYAFRLREFDLAAEAAGKASPDAASFRKNGVYLITGGTGGLGLIFADYLASQYGARLILAGRSEPGEEQLQAIAKINAGPGRAEYFRADMARRDEVARLIAAMKSQYGRINGVIHGAGVISDAYLHHKSLEELKKVIAPKVYGAIYLDELLRGEQFELFVMFSAIAALMGNPGQSDYAYANCFIDHYARTRAEAYHDTGRRGKILSINWPLWRDGGMRLDRRLMGILRASGLRPLENGDGIKALEMGLLADRSQFLVVDHEVRSGEPDLEESRLPSAVPGGEPSGRLAAASGPQPCDPLPEVKRGVKRVIAAQLKLRGDAIENDRDLKDYGYDSIMLTVLANRINEEYSLDMTPAVFFELEELTVDRFAAYLWDTYGGQAEFQAAFALPAGEVPAAPDSAALAGPATAFPEEVAAARLDCDDGSAGKYRGAAPCCDETVAVIGIHGKMPRSDSLEEFWTHLENGADLVGEIPPERWDWRQYYGDPLEDGGNRTVCKWAALLNDVTAFDGKFFNISKREAELMDPQQRIMLETVWAAIEDAGYSAAAVAKSDTGLFIGVSNSDYGLALREIATEIQAQAATGLSQAIIANRISYLLDLRGPCEVINTACSSSLVAVHRAVEALRLGDCELAIAGGVNALLSPLSQIAFGKVGVLSAAGKCRAFDKDADGIVRGEGAGAVVLKPLRRAVADRDHIYAVIRGTGAKHGGRSTSLTAPNPAAQAELIRDTCGKAGVSPATLSYIECHGTGTRLGDPVEVNALKKAFDGCGPGGNAPENPVNYCGIGSVKTNIGHLEAAAGIAGMLKVLLAIKYRKLPANIHFQELNPYIELRDSPFYVVDTTKAWSPLRDETGREIARRAGVSAFGLGGTNAFVLLEEYPDWRRGRCGGLPQYVAVLSAKTRERLFEYCDRLLHYLSGARPQENWLLDLAYTLQVGREPMSERLAVVCQDPDQLCDRLGRFREGETAVPGVFIGSVGSGADDQLKSVFSGSGCLRLIREMVAANEYEQLAKLWCNGVAIDWRICYDGLQPGRIPLPTYPFARERYWPEPLDREEPFAQAGGRSASSAVARPDPLKDCFYQPAWFHEPLPEENGGAPKVAQGTAIIIHSDAGAELARALGDAHRAGTVIPARLGEATKRFPDGSWTISTGDETAFLRCLEGVADLESVYFLGVIDPQSPNWRDPEILARSGETGAVLLFRLFQALNVRGDTLRPIRVRVVTNNVHQVTPEELLIPVAGALPGLAAVAVKEFPAMNIGCLDLDFAKARPEGDEIPTTELTAAVRAIMNEPGAKKGDAVAVRRGARYVRRLEPLRLSPGDTLPFRPNGAYLILGGAGGLGLEIASYLAKSVNARVALLGRSPLDEAKREKIAGIEARDGAVLYIQADAGDPRGMEEAVALVQARFGTVHGVIHAAAALQDGIIERMTEAALREVLASKVKGSVVLGNIFQERTPDFMLFFSSVASFAGEAGRGAYTAASAFEDAYAAYLSQRTPFPVKVINWGYWGKTGIAAGPEYREIFKAKGVWPIEPAEGVEAVKRILGFSGPQAVMIKLNPGHAADGETVEAKAAERASPGKPGNGRQPGPAAEENPQAGKETVLSPSGNTVTGATEDYIREKIVAALCAGLKLESGEVGAKTVFTDLGVDSVLAIEIAHRISKELGIGLRSTDLINYATPAQLTRYLLHNFKITPPVAGTGQVPADSEIRDLLEQLRRGEIDPETVGRRLAIPAQPEISNQNAL